MPPWNLKARVVVPCANLMGTLGFEWSSVIDRSHDAGYNMSVETATVSWKTFNTCAVGGIANFKLKDEASSSNSSFRSSVASDS